MSGSQTVQEALEALLVPATAKGLAMLQLLPIDAAELPQYIARARQHVAPSYLPFATFTGAPLAVHLNPDAEIVDSPIVYVGTGSLTPKFVCGGLRDMARGAWLWVAAFFKNDPALLKNATSAVAAAVPNGRDVPEDLWRILREAPEYEPSWWYYDADNSTRDAWLAANVGHPFVRLPTVDFNDPAAALAQLQGLVAPGGGAAPQILAALIAAQRACGVPPSADAIFDVLGAEAWLGGDAVVEARWYPERSGLAPWNVALKAALDAEILQGTPFDPLRGHPEAYSGLDPAGPKLLEEVATGFRDSGRPREELCQLRNAALLGLHISGGYDARLCERVADACDRVRPGSAAAALARAYGAARPGDA